jgi:hypothetical protein
VAVSTVSASIGTSSDFSTISAWNTTLADYDLVALTNNPAWPASTVVAVGDLVKNDTPERIYICTVGGTTAGSGGPTGTGTGITDNGATWDFVCAVTSNKIIYEGRLKKETHTQTGTASLGNGCVMDDEGYAILRCAVGGSFLDDASRVLIFDSTRGADITMSNHNGTSYTISAYFHVTGVMITGTGIFNPGAGMINGGGKVYRNIIRFTTAGNGRGTMIRLGATVQLVNNLLYFHGTTSSTTATLEQSFSSVGPRVAFNTCVFPANFSSGTGFGHSMHGTAELVKNSAFFGGQTDVLSKTGGGTLTTAQWNYNASNDDNTGFPAGNNVYDVTYSQTTPFVDSHGVDYSPIVGTSLINAGEDISADSAYISGDIDIWGTTRSATPTIGCVEYVPLPINLSAETETILSQTTATLTVVSDTAAGTLHCYVSESATPPSTANHLSGFGAVFHSKIP